MFRKKIKIKTVISKQKIIPKFQALPQQKTKQEIYHEQGLIGLFHTMKGKHEKEDTKDLDDDIINLFG